MTRPTLSVALPVYNFAAFLPETLDSIFTQDGADDVDVVVVDGASTDDTANVVGRYVAAHSNLRYVRLPQKGGIDRDMALAVDHATGDYVWLFSGDDLMLPGALAKARARIESGLDLYLCKHLEHRRKEGADVEWAVTQSNAEATTQFSDRAQRQNYFADAATAEAFFSFMGGLIVRRAAWHSGTLDERFVGSCYAHAARLMALMSQGLTMQFVPQAWQWRRPDNDSFAGGGVVKRFALAIDGYRLLSDTRWGHDSIEAFHIRRVIRAEFHIWVLLYGKFMCAIDPQRESRALLDRLVETAYCDNTFGNIWTKLRYRFTPAPRFARWNPEDAARLVNAVRERETTRGPRASRLAPNT